MTKNLPPLFGFGGKPTSGKDTVADWMVKHGGYTKVNMSTAIADLASEINPIVGRRPGILGFFRRLERYNDVVARRGFTDAKKHPEVRRALQDIGTGVRNVIGVNTWSEIGGRAIRKLREAGYSVVLSGVRFPSEAAMITESGGTLVWVERPGIVEDANTNHVVENSIAESDFDVTLRNDGTLHDLKLKAFDLIDGPSK